MTQDAKTTFWEELKRDWNSGKSTSKTQWSGQSFEVRGESVSRLTLGSRLVVELFFNGL